MKTFVLVRWLEDESVGVMPITAAVHHSEEALCPGKMTKMKYGKSKKLYDVEILKISEDQRQLKKDVEKLINFEILPEELISDTTDSPQCEVSSTTPIKEPATKAEKRKKKRKSSTVKKSREKEIASAITKAKRLFTASNDKEEELKVIEQERHTEDPVHNSKRQKIHVEEQDTCTPVRRQEQQDTLIHDARIEERDTSTHDARNVEEQEDLIHLADTPVQRASAFMQTVTRNNMPITDGAHANSQYKSLQAKSALVSEDPYGMAHPYAKWKIPKSGSLDMGFSQEQLSFDGSASSLDFVSSDMDDDLPLYQSSPLSNHHALYYNPSHSSPRTPHYPVVPPYYNFSSVHHHPNTVSHKCEDYVQQERTPKNEYKQELEIFNRKRGQPAKVELVEGYGVFLTKRELDDAIDSSRGIPTRLVRNLISVFFSRDTLATSSALGSRKHQALDKDILSACLRYVQSKHEVGRTALIDSINDKCANARRQVKSQTS